LGEYHDDHTSKRLETKPSPSVPAMAVLFGFARKALWKGEKLTPKWPKRIVLTPQATFFLHFACRFPYNLRLLEALSSFLRFRILTDWGWYE
jgi:hypothetical protein